MTVSLNVQEIYKEREREGKGRVNRESSSSLPMRYYSIHSVFFETTVIGSALEYVCRLALVKRVTTGGARRLSMTAK